MIKVKRAYEPAAPDDGRRFLVDRLWPRGVTKEALALEAWCKDAAPSTALREWSHHDPQKWDEFRRRYAAELDEQREVWQPLADAAREGVITLVYGAREEVRNNAVALKEYLEHQLSPDDRQS